MAQEKKGEGKDRNQYRLELVGLAPEGERPSVVVQVTDKKNAVLHSQAVTADGAFTIPPDILKKAHRVVLGAPDGNKGIQAETALSFRASEFTAQIRDGTLAVAEGIWSRFLFHWVCVSGSVRVCRRRPWWFDSLITAAISCDVGQMSFRYTGPSLPVPTGSVVRSRSTVPAIAYATTSGGEARKFALRLGWIRASKLRLPESTAAQTRSLPVIASLISGVRSPALPMHVVQPYAVTPNPSFSRKGSSPALPR